MWLRFLCVHGEFEELKAAVHGVMLTGAIACAAYNTLAFCRRHETHSAVNAALYTALAILEVTHVQSHLEARL